MSNTIAITKTNDGDRHVIVQVFIQADGSGDESGHVLIDPYEDLSPNLPRKPIFAIQEIWYDIDGFNTTLSFGGLVDVPAWTLSQGSGNRICFDSIGGLVDRNGTDGDGKLLLSTVGFDTAGKQGSMVIKLRKR